MYENNRGVFQAAQIDEHHVFMKGSSDLLGGDRWETFWNQRGIDTHDFVVDVDANFHQALHAGPGGGGWWEQELFDRVRRAERVGGQLDAARAETLVRDLMSRMGIGGGQFHRYTGPI